MSNGSGSRSSLSTRFVVLFLATYLVLIGLIAFIVDRSVRTPLLDQVDHNLTVAARLSQQSLPESEAEYEVWAGEAYSNSGFRTTLIDTDGSVVADSHSTPDLLENHLDRPEVQAALNGEVGAATRTSESTGFEQRYLALPPEDGLIVRTSVALRVINDQLASLRTTLLIAALVLGLLGVVVAGLMGRRLAQPIVELTGQARAVSEGATAVSTKRSRVRELDELGLVISAIATRLGARVADAEAATATLEVVLGALPQGTILIDDDDRVAYANPSAYSILGSVPDDLSGMAPLQFQNAVREAKESRDQVSRVIDHGSPTRRIRGVATPFSGDERVLLLLVDITERERTDSVRRDFVANASHELKTPVSTIIASSEALRIALDRGDQSASAFATRIEDSARQLDRLVGDLLDLSRLEKDRPEMAPVRLDHLVRDEVERIRGGAESKGLTVEVRSDEVTVPVNHRDVAIAVRNVLDNAVRYTPSGGAVAVDVSIQNGDAVISVSDTGEGIPTRDIERVFERFYRVDSARARATGGTGLGLSIVKHVAESHGGLVSVQSELGVGSTFAIRLPLDGEGEAPEAN